MQTLRSLAAQMEDLFSEIDQAVAAYASQSSLSCPSGCGSCCESPGVEATLLDMLPMALNLYEQGLTELPPSPSSLCPRFESHGNGRGRCLSYEHRPTVCRLFGFAGIRNKHGLVQLSHCRVHKQLGQHPNPNATPPLFESPARSLIGIHPGYGTERLPIYEALRQALDKIALAAAYSSAAHACATARAAPVPPGPSRYSAFHSGDFCS